MTIEQILQDQIDQLAIDIYGCKEEEKRLSRTGDYADCIELKGAHSAFARISFRLKSELKKLNEKK